VVKRGTAALITTGLVAASLVLAPSAPAGVPTAGCSFTSGVLTVTDPDGGELTIGHSGTSIYVQDPVTLSCGSPTMTNTERIDVTATGSVDNELTILFSMGPYAPGATDELDGGSEIEFRISLGPNGAGGDSIQLNQIPDATAGTAGVNLNPAAETADEVDLTGPDGSSAPSDIDFWSFSGAAGGTSLAANGDSGAGGNFPYPITFYGSSETDTVFGSMAGDHLDGAYGNDLLEGGLGKDTLLGSEGIDKLKAKDGVKDAKINCGPGKNRRESARIDGKDPEPKSC
jgi:hypothetical protein